MSASLDVHEWICFGVVFSIPAAKWKKIAIIGTQLPVGTCYLWERLSAEVHKVLCGERPPPWTYIYTGPCLPPHHTTVLPKRYDDWPLIAANVQARHYYVSPWNLPHCPGAMDGKHVVLKAPSNSGPILLSDLHRHLFTCPDGFGALTPTWDLFALTWAVTVATVTRGESVSGDSSVVRASDSWSKGPGFESRQERREKFFLQGQLSVLLFRYPFHPRVPAVTRERSRSACQKYRWQVKAKHTPYLCGFEWSDNVN